MAIDFPNSPALNDEFSAEGRTWIWNGYAWDSVGTVISQGPAGPAGPQGPPGNLENLTATSPIVYGGNNISFAGIALDDITNVTAPTPTTGDFLKWDGTAWVNSVVNQAYAINDLTDVVITGTPTIGDIIVFDGTNWVNQSNASTGQTLNDTFMMMGA